LIPRRPLEKASLFDWSHLYYSKNSFLGKANTKIARDNKPLFGEPRRARRATKSMGGALRRPKNGFQKI